MKGSEILDLKMVENDADADTIRDYFKELLRELWTTTEGFSGKRPFGNSGWDYEIYRSLIENGAVEAEINEDGYIETFDEKQRAKADKLIFKAIKAL